MMTAGISIAFLAAAIFYMHSETKKLEINRIDFSDSPDSLKIIHISDIHISKMNIPFTRIQEFIQSEKPDLVIITGDCIDKEAHRAKFMRFLDYIDSRIVLCLGNHDYKALRNSPSKVIHFIDQLQTKGVEVLDNRNITIEKGNRKFNIVGISDIRYLHQDVRKAFAGVDSHGCANIVISHNPDIVLELKKFNHKIDCLLCGHLHGGQVRTFTNIEFLFMLKEKLWKKGYIKGLRHFGDIPIYINKGLGNSRLALRLFSRPEAAVFRF